jgi:hypothetical protein
MRGEVSFSFAESSPTAVPPRRTRWKHPPWQPAPGQGWTDHKQDKPSEPAGRSGMQARSSDRCRLSRVAARIAGTKRKPGWPSGGAVTLPISSNPGPWAPPWLQIRGFRGGGHDQDGAAMSTAGRRGGRSQWLRMDVPSRSRLLRSRSRLPLPIREVAEPGDGVRSPHDDAT